MKNRKFFIKNDILAEYKYATLGLKYKLKGLVPPSKERMDELKKYFENSSPLLKVKIGG